MFVTPIDADSLVLRYKFVLDKLDKQTKRSRLFHSRKPEARQAFWLQRVLDSSQLRIQTYLRLNGSLYVTLERFVTITLPAAIYGPPIVSSDWHVDVRPDMPSGYHRFIPRRCSAIATSVPRGVPSCDLQYYDVSAGIMRCLSQHLYVGHRMAAANVSRVSISSHQRPATADTSFFVRIDLHFGRLQLHAVRLLRYFDGGYIHGICSPVTVTYSQLVVRTRRARCL